MKRAKKLGCMMLICTLFFTMMMPYQVFAADNSRAASIVDMEGKVQILKAGGEKAFSAFKGMNLTQGDRIITGKDAWVKLDIDQNKEIKLAENTDMTMSELLGSVNDKNDQTFLNLLVGKAWIFIKEKLNVNAKFEIKTPTTVMGVRGTQFFVQEQDGQTYVTVVEGTVAVSTYAVVENPDGTIQLKPVEVTLNHNQQVAFDAGVRSGEAPQVQEAQLENMDRFMLEAIRDSVPGLAPETVERMDRLIEQRRAEEVQQQQQPQRNEIIENSVIRSSDTTTTTTTSSGGSDDPSPVVVPAPKISEVNVVNGAINVVFDRNLSGAPQKDDFEVKQNVCEGDAVLMDITQVQWDNGSNNVTLIVEPLKPGAFEQEFYYSVSYKEDRDKKSDNTIVPGIQSGDVRVSDYGPYYVDSSIQLEITNVTTTDEKLLNLDGTFDNSSFDIEIISDLDGVISISNSSVKFGQDGCVIEAQQPAITLSTEGEHTLSVYVNGKRITDSLKLAMKIPGGGGSYIPMYVKLFRDFVTQGEPFSLDIFLAQEYEGNDISYCVTIISSNPDEGESIDGVGNNVVLYTDVKPVPNEDDLYKTKLKVNDITLFYPDIQRLRVIVHTNENEEFVSENTTIRVRNSYISGIEVTAETLTPMTYIPFSIVFDEYEEFVNTQQQVTITSDNILEGVLGELYNESVYFYGYEGNMYGLPKIMLTQPGPQTITVQIKGIEGKVTINLEVIEPHIPNSNSIAAGYSHGLSIENGDNSVLQWGENYLTVWEDVYSNAYSDIYLPGERMPVGIENLSDVKKIAGGQSYTVALKNDGTVWTWGVNYNGQLGNENTEFSAHPIQVSALDGIKITDIAAGEFHVAALDEYGRVWTWGSNGCGQLGINSSEYCSYVPVRVVDGDSESESGYLENVAAVAAGALHTVVLKNDGTVWTWGYNSFGQLGSGDTSDYMINYPIKVVQDADTLPYAIKIAAGQEHTLALSQDGTVWAWGSNSNGQLGNQTAESGSAIPVQVVMPQEDGSGYSGIVQLAAGGSHSLALKDNGTVWGWGNNSYGQIGGYEQEYYADTNILTPIQVIEEHSVAGAVYLQDVKVISAGFDYSLGLKNDGTIWAWGDNSAGQLGNGQTYSCSYRPVQVGMLEESYPPEEENIHVNNNEEGMDSITVGGIPPQSIIKIYDAEVGGNLLGAAKCSWDDVTVYLTEGDLDQVSGSIWVTIIEDVRFKESIRVRKTF